MIPVNKTLPSGKYHNHNNRRTAMSNKPKWVEALESAETTLRKAEAAVTSDEQSSLNAVAHTWLAIAREYREQPTA